MSTRFQDHEGLMHQWARKFHARLMAARLNIEFDDVMGELSLAYTKAMQGFDADRGYTFTAYLGTACHNHFNKYAKRLMLEQYGAESAAEAFEKAGKQGLGYISVQEIEAGDPDGGSFYDAIEDDNTFATPEQVVDAAMTFGDIVRDTTLLPQTRAYLANLINPDVQLSEAVRASINAHAQQIKRQVFARWGITIYKISL
jgi:Sigma-70 region 2